LGIQEVHGVSRGHHSYPLTRLVGLLHVDFRPFRPIRWACTMENHSGREKWWKLETVGYVLK